MVAGVDVGGTFTDLLILDAGAVRLVKTPTTPSNQALGVLAALDAAGLALDRLDLLVHGTTVTTNALLERRLARTGLITTEGFRDILELGRRTRPAAYGMTGRFTPLVPRDLRLEVPERTDARGRILTPLDEQATRAAVARLLAQGCDSLVIHFLHAYANPAHELRAAEIAREAWPNPHVTLGHALTSESREFERGVTACVNAAVEPLLDRYLARLTRDLAERGFRRDLLVMTGNGGMTSAARVAREAARTVMSGPASGVIAAAYTAARAGLTDLVTYDMGGTSTDVALIRGGRPAVSSEIELDYALPVHVPMLDVRTVGAGGGSIARLTSAGLLEVGPASAGADPGPAAAGRGNPEPTITDAHLVLGRLDPSRFPAPEAAHAAIARIAAPLGLDPASAAEAVLRIADTHMANAIRMVSLSLGADPRDLTLFAFGGAGPLHATALARELGIPRVLVPARPGLTNALGCIVADLRHDFVRTLARPLPDLDMGLVHATLAAQEAEGRRLIAGEAITPEAVTVAHAADMQFVGQTHLLRVPLPDARPSRATLHALFEAAYHARFRVRLPEIRPALVNLATTVTGHRPPLDLAALLDPAARAATLAEAETARRPVRFAGRWHDAPVYARHRLPRAATLAGPAIVEQLDATTALAPGDRAELDGDGNLRVEIGS